MFQQSEKCQFEAFFNLFGDLAAKNFIKNFKLNEETKILTINFNKK